MVNLLIKFFNRLKILYKKYCCKGIFVKSKKNKGKSVIYLIVGISWGNFQIIETKWILKLKYKD